MPKGNEGRVARRPVDPQPNFAAGLTDEDYDWSKYSVEIPEVLLNPEDLEFWRSREPVYYELSQLKSTVFEVSVKDGVLQIADYLPGHGVAFYEIRGVAPAP